MGKKVYEFIVDREGLNVRSFLRQNQGISRALLVSCKKEKGILLNGLSTYLDHPVRKGDQIRLVLPEEKSENIVPEPIPFEEVYEDEEILVVNKPPHLCVHPTMLHSSGTLANGVVYQWMQKGEIRKFRPVNRLDKDTSGLVLIAKSQYAHQQLSTMQKEGKINRYYEALVEGVILEGEGTICAPIMRKEDSIMERIVHEEGQYAVTHYRVLQRLSNCTHIQLKLDTGRTHQIRVHMKHFGHPLLGDDLYGGNKNLIARQALHSRILSFPHPLSKKIHTFTIPLPEDMLKVIEQMGGNLYP